MSQILPLHLLLFPITTGNSTSTTSPRISPATTVKSLLLLLNRLPHLWRRHDGAVCVVRVVWGVELRWHLVGVSVVGVPRQGLLLLLELRRWLLLLLWLLALLLLELSGRLLLLLKLWGLLLPLLLLLLLWLLLELRWLRTLLLRWLLLEL